MLIKTIRKRINRFLLIAMLSGGSPFILEGCFQDFFEVADEATTTGSGGGGGGGWGTGYCSWCFGSSSGGGSGIAPPFGS